MSLPTNRAQGDTIDPADINAIATVVNELLQNGTAGPTLDAEAVQDTVAAMLKPGTGVDLSYNDAAGTLTVTSTATGGTTSGFIVPSLTTGSTAAASNTTAIHAALTQARTDKKIVLLPGGTWYVNTLTVQSGDYIMGPGNARCVLVVPGAQHGIVGTKCAYLTLKGFKLEGAGKTSGLWDGIRLLNLTDTPDNMSPYLLVEDVYVRTFGRHGFYLENTWVAHLNRCFSESNGQHGFYLLGKNNIGGTSTALTACYANANGAVGYLVNTMNYCALTACAADSNETGYLLQNSQGITLTSCGSEATMGRAWVIEGSYSCTLEAPWDYMTKGACGIDVVSGSQQISINSYREVNPGAAKTASIRVASGTSGTVTNYKGIRPHSGLGGGYWSKPDRLGEEPATINGATTADRLDQVETVLRSMGRVIW